MAFTTFLSARVVSPSKTLRLYTLQAFRSLLPNCTVAASAEEHAWCLNLMRLLICSLTIFVHMGLPLQRQTIIAASGNVLHRILFRRRDLYLCYLGPSLQFSSQLGGLIKHVAVHYRVTGCSMFLCAWDCAKTVNYPLAVLPR